MQPVAPLDPNFPCHYCDGMTARTVSFETLQNDKRRARMRDERRLARDEVTPEQLQRENSLVSTGTKITIPDFCATLERHYGR